MDAARLENLAADFTSQSPLNHVCIELSGEELTLFDRPLLGYACAGDPLFEAFLAPGVIGPHYRPPQAWLETAQTVVSFFLPSVRPCVLKTAPLNPCPVRPGSMAGWRASALWRR